VQHALLDQELRPRDVAVALEERVVEVEEGELHRLSLARAGALLQQRHGDRPPGLERVAVERVERGHERAHVARACVRR
jgi:hypothetical protein